MELVISSPFPSLPRDPLHFLGLDHFRDRFKVLFGLESHFSTPTPNITTPSCCQYICLPALPPEEAGAARRMPHLPFRIR